MRHDAHLQRLPICCASSPWTARLSLYFSEFRAPLRTLDEVFVCGGTVCLRAWGTVEYSGPMGLCSRPIVCFPIATSPKSYGVSPFVEAKILNEHQELYHIAFSQ